MPCLVQRAKESLGKSVLVVACGDSHIAGANAGTEGMHCDIKPAAAAIKTHLLSNPFGELSLLFNGIAASQYLAWCLDAASLNGCDERNEFILELFEEYFQVIGPGAWLELIDKGIV